MKGQDKRRHRRLRMRVPVSFKAGNVADRSLTNNISSGGLYLHVSEKGCPQPGAMVNFELQIPPGDGYSATEGKIRGEGKVVRIDALLGKQSGLAIQFTNPLALDF